MSKFLPLEALREFAREEAAIYDIEWEHMEDPQTYADFMSSLNTAVARIFGAEHIYRSLLIAHETGEWANLDELEEMMVTTQDLLIESYVCRDLLERVEAIQAVLQ